MFKSGFEKIALDWNRVAKSGMKALKSPTVLRNAAIGAGGGAAAGAAANPEDRLGGAVKGAIGGGLLGGAGTAGFRAYKTDARFAGKMGDITKKHMAGKASRLQARAGNIYEGT